MHSVVFPRMRMALVEKAIALLAACLWLLPPMVALHISPLPNLLKEVRAQLWIEYFAFALATYILLRWFDPKRAGPVVIGICVIAFCVESFHVAYFGHGDGEGFRTTHFIAALVGIALGIGLGTSLIKFPNRWDYL